MVSLEERVERLEKRLEEYERERLWKAMVDAGAVVLNCPVCKKVTPVYPNPQEPDRPWTNCLFCGAELQVKAIVREKI